MYEFERKLSRKANQKRSKIFDLNWKPQVLQAPYPLWVDEKSFVQKMKVSN